MSNATTNPPGRFQRVTNSWNQLRSALSGFGQGAQAENSNNDGRYSYVITIAEHQQRVFFALLVWALSFILTWQIGVYFFGYFSGSFFGPAIWLMLWGATLEHFVVVVPEITALFTKNLLRRPTDEDEFANLLVYPTGLYFKFPWEIMNFSNFINLRWVTSDFSESIASKKGPMLDLKFLFLWRPNIHLLPINISFDGLSVNQELSSYLTSIFTRIIARRDVHTARSGVHNIEGEVRKQVIDRSLSALEGTKTERRAHRFGYQADLEFFLGAEIGPGRIVDADYEKGFQESILKDRVAQMVNERAKELVDKHHLDPKEAHNAALIIFGLVKKEVKETEFKQEQIASIINDMFTHFYGAYFDYRTAKDAADRAATA